MEDQTPEERARAEIEAAVQQHAQGFVFAAKRAKLFFEIFTAVGLSPEATQAAFTQWQANQAHLDMHYKMGDIARDAYEQAAQLADQCVSGVGLGSDTAKWIAERIRALKGGA